MIETLKKYWPLIAIASFLVGFGDQLKAVASAPTQLKQTQESIQQLSEDLKVYAASQDEANKQRDKLIELLTKQAMENNE